MGNAGFRQTSATDIKQGKFAFHKVTSVKPLDDYRIEVTFENSSIKEYDVKPLFSKWDVFCALRDEPGLFALVGIEPGGYAISWNDNIDLSCEELWQNGE